MSQVRCDKCGHLYSANLTYVGEVCGVRLSGTEWCRGKIVEHECGGPREACGLRGCEECDNRTALRAALEKSRDEVAKLRAIVAELQKLLEAHGCDCPCDHHADERGPDCEVCLACRVEAIIREEPQR